MDVWCGSKAVNPTYLNRFHPSLNIHRLSSCTKLAKILVIV